ncbi:hypothetical protein [Cesiribacter sp. SM1]|uniref:hypothetical protein n=1 Tax=Cesiribacter sp. SM1 TaxID=2861196 RepID=UPI001CD6F208|nr:hypothetical protein [Cesiribacter sp. SM1]
MIIDNKAEIHALHKLLATVKYSDQIDSYDLNEFANSPLITNLLKKVRQEYIEILKQDGRAALAEEWIKNSKFTFDSNTGKSVAARLKHLSPSVLSTISDWDRKEVKDFATGLVEPLTYDDEEIEKLTDYIIKLTKENK